VRIAGTPHLAAAEDAARLRDGLGVALPPGLPTAFTDPVPVPLDDLVARYARTHGPFAVADVAQRFDATRERVQHSLGQLEADGRVVLGEFRPGGVEREWCDTNVLRVLRRRSLAALRHEIEPVDTATLARFLPAWHGVQKGRRGIDALVETLEQLQGVAIPASVLERDVLPARVDGYRPTMLDELCAAGELVWIGAGPLGHDDGKVRCYFRDRVQLLAPPPVSAEDRPDGPLHDALRGHLQTHGASFWWDLMGAVSAASEPEVLAALWDLVWSGEVTNDTFAPLRAPRRAQKRSSSGRRGRPQVGRLARLGPPAGQGRWSRVAPLVEPRAEPTAAAHALALQLLERHGVVTRESVRAEGIAGGFAGIYPVFRALEEAGRARRGWFVAGMGGAQFASPGAVDRLRSFRDANPDEPQLLALAATDPAQPFGGALPWPDHPGRPARAAGAYVVLARGAVVAYVERSGKSMLTFAGAKDDPAEWIEVLVAAHKEGRIPRLALERIDDEPARSSPFADALRAAGFADGYKGLTLKG
jgi:ATP-dependent Lhr-like helicase